MTTWKGMLLSVGVMGNHDHEVGTALIEGIYGNHEDGAKPGLLMAAKGIQVGESNDVSRGWGPAGMDQGA